MNDVPCLAVDFESRNASAVGQSAKYSLMKELTVNQLGISVKDASVSLTAECFRASSSPSADATECTKG